MLEYRDMFGIRPDGYANVDINVYSYRTFVRHIKRCLKKA